MIVLQSLIKEWKKENIRVNYDEKWNIKNKEKMEKYQKKWYQKNKEKVLKQCYIYKKNNKEKIYEVFDKVEADAYVRKKTIYAIKKELKDEQ